MAVMGERLPEAWMVELHRNGRVEFPLRRWTLLQWLPLLASMFLAPAMPELLDGDWRFAGYLMVLAYAGTLAAIVRQLVTQRPVVIVDRRGIHRPPAVHGVERDRLVRVRVRIEAGAAVSGDPEGPAGEESRHRPGARERPGGFPALARRAARRVSAGGAR